MAATHTELTGGGARRRAWAVIALLGIWSFPALLNFLLTQAQIALQGTTPSRDPVRDLLVVQLPSWYVWAVATPGIFWVAARFPPLPGRRHLASFVAHGSTFLAVALVHPAVYVLLEMLAGFFPEGFTYGTIFAFSASRLLIFEILAYLAVAGAGTGWVLLRESRERELHASRLQAQLSDARLQALRTRLHPHFLFNALNTVAMMVRRGADRQALDLLVGFSELLRQVLDQDAPEVSLDEELRFVRRYLEIEGARFQGMLTSSVHSDADAAAAAVPTLILQPLIENAFRHGVSQREEPGSVRVEARALEGRLRLEVDNDGPPLPAGQLVEGIGLRTTRSRLEERFGSDFVLDVRDREGGVTAVVDIPFRPAPPAHGALR